MTIPDQLKEAQEEIVRLRLLAITLVMCNDLDVLARYREAGRAMAAANRWPTEESRRASKRVARALGETK